MVKMLSIRLQTAVGEYYSWIGAVLRGLILRAARHRPLTGVLFWWKSCWRPRPRTTRRRSRLCRSVCVLLSATEYTMRNIYWEYNIMGYCGLCYLSTTEYTFSMGYSGLRYLQQQQNIYAEQHLLCVYVPGPLVTPWAFANIYACVHVCTYPGPLPPHGSLQTYVCVLCI